MKKPSPGARLHSIIEEVKPRLDKVSEADSVLRPSPGKWFKREILGHLVDSATNNHRRFVRAQARGSLIFDGYKQEEWVALQKYQAIPWRATVGLWYYFNLHLARVMDAVPDSVRLRETTEHNLHEIAWKPVKEGTPASLDYLMHDYVDHLVHHLKQVL